MTLDDIVRNEASTLLLAILKATALERVKPWALSVAFKFALSRAQDTNPTEIWKFLEAVYEERLREIFTNQHDPAQSFRRASGDAFEDFVEDYLNSTPVLQKAGIRAIRLIGDDFSKFTRSLSLENVLRPRDVDMFLQGIILDGRPTIFGAVFPKVSYAERIRADEGASRHLMDKGLFSITVTLDARGELGTEQRPSVKRQTINRGGFDACYSFNWDTQSNGRIYPINVHEKGLRKNRLLRDIVRRWEQARG